MPFLELNLNQFVKLGFVLTDGGAVRGGKGV